MYDVVKTLIDNQLSVVPILDEEDNLLDVFSKYDFHTICNNGIIDLNVPVRKILDERPDYIEGCVSMPINCTIGQLLR